MATATTIVTPNSAVCLQERVPINQALIVTGDSLSAAMSPNATPKPPRTHHAYARRAGKKEATLPAASCSPIAGARSATTTAPTIPVLNTRTIAVPNRATQAPMVHSAKPNGAIAANGRHRTAMGGGEIRGDAEVGAGTTYLSPVVSA